MSRSLTAWLRRVSLAERSRSSFALKFFVCKFSFSSWCWWWLSVGTPGSLELDFVLEPIADVELSNEVFTFRVRWMTLIIEWNAFANMLYLLKKFLLLILIISKLKCNNLIFNEIMILNVLYVCLTHSRFVQNHPIWILKDGSIISEVLLSYKSYSI
jgi:hypothetical protein